MERGDKRIIISIDNNRHLNYTANFDDIETMLRMVQMVLSVMGSQVKKQRLN